MYEEFNNDKDAEKASWVWTGPPAEHIRKEDYVRPDYRITEEQSKLIDKELALKQDLAKLLAGSDNMDKVLDKADACVYLQDSGAISMEAWNSLKTNQSDILDDNDNRLSKQQVQELIDSGMEFKDDTPAKQITADDLKPGMRVMLKKLEDCNAKQFPHINEGMHKYFNSVVTVETVDELSFESTGKDVWRYHPDWIAKILPDQETDNGDLIPMPTIMTLTVGVPVFIVPGMVVEVCNDPTPLEIFNIHNDGYFFVADENDDFQYHVRDITKIISTPPPDSPLLWKKGKS